MEENSKKKLRPQDRWDAKSGIVAKTYKVNKEVAEKFKEACKKAGIGPIPSCAECSWENVHIEEIGACTLLTNEMLKQLEGGVMSIAEATVFIVMLIYTGFVIYILRK